jgi:Malectin domain
MKFLQFGSYGAFQLAVFGRIFEDKERKPAIGGVKGYSFTYEILAENNLEHLLTFKFAEVYHNAAGLQQFSVLLEDEMKIANFPAHHESLQFAEKDHEVVCRHLHRLQKIKSNALGFGHHLLKIANSPLRITLPEGRIKVSGSTYGEVRLDGTILGVKYTLSSTIKTQSQVTSLMLERTD